MLIKIILYLLEGTQGVFFSQTKPVMNVAYAHARIVQRFKLQTFYDAGTISNP